MRRGQAMHLALLWKCGGVSHRVGPAVGLGTTMGRAAEDCPRKFRRPYSLPQLPAVPIGWPLLRQGYTCGGANTFNDTGLIKYNRGS